MENSEENQELRGKSSSIHRGICEGPRCVHEESFTNVVKCAAFNPVNELFYLVAENGVVECYNLQGKMVFIRQLDHPFSRMTYNACAKVFIGWTRESTLINIIGEDATEVTTTFHESPIQVLSSSGASAEVVLVDFQNVFMRWVFGKSPGELLPVQVLMISSSRFDSEMTLIDIGELKFSKKDPDKCRCCYGNGIMELNYKKEETVYHPNLHTSRVSTCLEFSSELIPVTGAEDGTIKMWTNDWKCRRVFLGHLGNVMQLETIFDDHFLVSLGKDNTLRWWHPLSITEIGKITLKFTIGGMALKKESKNSFLFYSEARGSWWSWKQLFTLSKVFNSPICRFNSVLNPLYPPILFVGCQNNTFHVINGGSGEIISQFQLDFDVASAPLACSISEGFMIIANEKQNCLEKFTLSTDSSAVTRQTWPSSENVSCMALYESNKSISALDNYQLTYSTCGDLIVESKLFNQLSFGAIELEEKRSLLVFVVQKDGDIVIKETAQGQTLYHTKGKNEAEVTKLIIDKKREEMISIGKDGLVIFWHILAHSGLHLMPYRNTHFPFSCLLSTTLSNHLAAASDLPECYDIIIYDMDKQEFEEPSMDQSHTDTVTGITSLETLNMFCSSAKDKTIRIWSTNNILLRLLSIDRIPQNAIFSSTNGDLMMVAHKYIFVLLSDLYVPPEILCKRKLNGNGKLIQKERKQTEEECNVITIENAEENSTIELISAEESEEKKQFMERLEERNQDILMIRNGIYSFTQFTERCHKKKIEF